jgi:hypothetical protein
MFFHEPLGVMNFGPVSDDGSLQADQRWLNADIMTQPVGFCNPAESRRWLADKSPVRADY